MFFLQAYCRLNYVKIMKVMTEDMLSDSLTKVMTMPKHHVQKRGLRDLTIASIGMVRATQGTKAEAVLDEMDDKQCICLRGGWGRCVIRSVPGQQLCRACSLRGPVCQWVLQL